MVTVGLETTRAFQFESRIKEGKETGNIIVDPGLRRFWVEAPEYRTLRPKPRGSRPQCIVLYAKSPGSTQMMLKVLLFSRESVQPTV